MLNEDENVMPEDIEDDNVVEEDGFEDDYLEDDEDDDEDEFDENEDLGMDIDSDEDNASAPDTATKSMFTDEELAALDKPEDDDTGESKRSWFKGI